MKLRHRLLPCALAALALAAGCNQKSVPPTETPARATGSPPADSRPSDADASPESPSSPTTPAAPSGFTGTVTETMNSGGYTYIQVDTGSERIWAAAPMFQVAVGTSVVLPPGMAMRNFYSRTLDRKFETVYFVPSVQVAGGGPPAAGEGVRLPDAHPPVPEGARPSMPAGHPPVARGSAGPESVEIGDIKKAEGGKTVAEIFAGKTDLAGKPVAVRGQVVKFSPNILGKNWIHIRDGSGSKGTNDLTVTTGAVAKVGDTVLVEGTVAIDKAFGAGYSYDVMIEDAEVTVE